METFIFLEKNCFGVWLDPRDTTKLHSGSLKELPAGAELIAISPNIEGARTAVRYYTAVNTNVRAAAA